MALDEGILHVVEDIYGAALEPARWPDALDRVADCVAADHAHVFVVGTETFAPLFAAVGHAFPVDLLGDYHAHYHALDPRIEAGRRLPAGVLYPDHLLCDPEAFERSEFYNDFYRRCGLRWMIGAMLERTETVTVGFAVVRTLRQEPFQDRDARLLGLLQPHLTNAARVQRRLAQDASAWAMGLEALDRLAIGIVVLDTRGRAVAVNRAAREIVASGDGLSLGPDGLHAANGPDAGALDEALAAGLRCARGEAIAGPATVPLRRPSLRRPYEVLVVAPLPAHATPWGLREAGVLVLISDPECAPEPPARLLARLHGLTPAEARAAAALAAGRSLKDIAEMAGITREAARWHLKQIFQKTGTHRQAELVKLLRAGPLGLARLDDSDG